MAHIGVSNLMNFITDKPAYHRRCGRKRDEYIVADNLVRGAIK
jgi:hypothetical protein